MRRRGFAGFVMVLGLVGLLPASPLLAEGPNPQEGSGVFEECLARKGEVETARCLVSAADSFPEDDRAASALLMAGRTLEDYLYPEEAGVIYQRLGLDYADAPVLCVPEKTPCAEELLLRSSALLWETRPEEVIEVLNEVVFHFEGRACARLRLELVQRNLAVRDYDKAVAVANDLLRTEEAPPYPLVTQHLIAVAYRAWGRTEDAEEAAEATEVLLEETQAWLERGEGEDEVRALTQALVTSVHRAHLLVEVEEAFELPLFSRGLRKHIYTQNQLKKVLEVVKVAARRYQAFASRSISDRAQLEYALFEAEIYEEFVLLLEGQKLPKRADEDERRGLQNALDVNCWKAERRLLKVLPEVLEQAHKLAFYGPETLDAQRLLFALRPLEERSYQEIFTQPQRRTLSWASLESPLGMEREI